MNSCEMCFPGYDARSQRGPIRWELFLHPEIRDVLLTARRDTLCVVYRGDPQPAAWSATLSAGGFPTPWFGAAGSDQRGHGSDAAAA